MTIHTRRGADGEEIRSTGLGCAAVGAARPPIVTLKFVTRGMLRSFVLENNRERDRERETERERERERGRER